MEIKLIPTAAMQRKSENDSLVCETFAAYKAKYPQASASLIIRSMVVNGGLPYESFAGIRSSLIRGGAILTRSRK